MGSFSLGVLSTIDEPLLPYYLDSFIKNNISDIYVICDEKNVSNKDKIIWHERTLGFINHNNQKNIYNYNRKSLPFYFVSNHNSKQAINLYKSLKLECLFNAGTPRKISTKIINLMGIGVVNIHPGILPQYRGCSAVEWAIFNDEKIGNTAHFMDKGYDTGPIILSESYNFFKNIEYVKIRRHVYNKGCKLAGKVVSMIKKNKITKLSSSLVVQDEDIAKYYPPISEEKLKNIILKVSENRYKYQNK